MDPIIIIGAGLLAYLLYFQSYAASDGLPADAAFTSEVAAGTAAAVPQSWASGASVAPGTDTTAISYLYYGPSENTYYLVATAPTAAQTAAGAAFLALVQQESLLSAPTPAPAPTPAAPATPAPATTPAPFIAGSSQSACPPGYVFAQAGFLPPTASAPLTTAGCVYMPSNPLATPLSGFRGMGAIRSPYWT